jgi:hypothetical protein
VLRRGRRQRTLLLGTREVHVIKSAAHSLVAVYAALCGRAGCTLRAADRRALARLARILNAARGSPASRVLASGTRGPGARARPGATLQ